MEKSALVQHALRYIVAESVAADIVRIRELINTNAESPMVVHALSEYLATLKEMERV